MSDPGRPRGFHLLDIAALVVGYSMASLLIRAFWPDGGRPPLAEIAAIGLVYLWLGLAMSGPLVLLVRRPAGPAVENPDPPEEPHGAHRARKPPRRCGLAGQPFAPTHDCWTRVRGPSSPG